MRRRRGFVLIDIFCNDFALFGATKISEEFRIKRVANETVGTFLGSSIIGKIIQHHLTIIIMGPG